MRQAKISIALNGLKMGLRPAIDAAAQLGVQGIQVDLRTDFLSENYGETARRELLHLLSERNLRIASGHFPLRNPLAASEHLGPRLAALEAAIQFAGKLKVRSLTLRAGQIPSQKDTEARSTFLSILNELAGSGNRYGVALCLIPCGESAAELRELISSIQTGPVLVDADLGAWVMNRQQVGIQLRELHDVIGHVEIRDAVRDADGRGREVAVGQGEIDWDEVTALLEEMAYSGWVNVDRREGTDPRGDIIRAVGFLKKRWLGSLGEA